MNRLSRVSHASATLACALVVVGVASASTASSKVLPRGADVVAKIAIPPETGGLAVGEGAVWVLSSDASKLTRINRAGKPVVAITVKPVKPCPPSPDTCGGIAAGNGAVWVVLGPDNAVARVDPKTNRVTTTIPVGPQPQGIATSDGAVWVVNAGGPSVTRIDPITNKVVATIRVGPTRACCDRTGVTAGGGSVWVSVPALGVVRVDPTTNKVTATIKLSWLESGQACGPIAIDNDAVWSAGAHCGTSSGYGVVTRIDPHTNKPTGTVTGFKAPIGIGAGFGSVWVADLDAQAIDRIDPRTGRISARLPVGGRPVLLVVGFGSVWVRDDDGRVLQIKPRG